MNKCWSTKPSSGFSNIKYAGWSDAPQDALAAALATGGDVGGDEQR